MAKGVADTYMLVLLQCVRGLSAKLTDILTSNPQELRAGECCVASLLV